MAPLPTGVLDSKEPKAPDKEEKSDLPKKVNAESHPESTSGAQADQITKQQPDEKEFLTLDEGQLKALLDEAITYKNPKDREGKSELFKELLQEAEQDESEKPLKIPKNYYNLPKRKHSRHQKECGVGTSTTRGGSLQNLYALGMEGTNRGGGGRSRRSGRGNETLVSARQREGGSLPTNVNAVNNETDLDICPNYTSRAIFKVNEPAKDVTSDPKSEELTATLSDAAACLPNGNDLAIASHSGLSFKEPEDQSSFANSLCAEQLREKAVDFMQCLINSDPALSMQVKKDRQYSLMMMKGLAALVGTSGPAFQPPSQTPMQQQHLSSINIPPPQIQPGPEDHSQSTDSKKINYNSRMVSNQRKATSGDLFSPPPEDDFTAGFLSQPLTAHWNRFSSFTLLDIRDPATRAVAFGRDRDSDKAKSFDENGNAVNGVVRLEPFDRQKKRRTKTKIDKNVVMSENIEGFRGGADIDSLISYINSSNDLDSNKGKSRLPNNQQGTHNNHVKPRPKEEDKPLKRRTKEKMQRCTSLEEISKTKLEDLTEESSSEKVNGPIVGQATKKKQVTLDDTQLGKKSTWDSEANLEVSPSTSNHVRDDSLEQESRDSIQDSEFHIVTKKQRKKKRRAASRGPAKPVCYGNKGFPAHDRSIERDGSRLLYQYRHGRGSESSSSQPRRKSASSVPPSDKSDTSDLDSVHSLPVASSRTKANKSASGGSTPQASYADIARTSASPPVVGSHSPYLSSADPIPSMLPAQLPPLIKTDSTNCDNYILHKEEYPPLEVVDSSVRFYRQNHKDTHDKICIKTIPVKNVIKIPSENSSSSQPLPVDVPSSHVKHLANSKRPPVILMDDSSANAQAPSEITFGFEVNQQLLCDTDPVCNTNVNPKSTSPLLESAKTNISTPQPPSVPLNSIKDPFLRTLIYFLDRGWEEAKQNVREGRGQYYEGQ